MITHICKTAGRLDGDRGARSFKLRWALWLLIAAGAVSGQAIFAATLTTDRRDYTPGELVTFTGTGWQPGENVHVDVYETSADPIFYEGGVSAVADASGNISNNDFVIQESFLGQGFMAYAVGASSGFNASAEFTDANVNNDFKQVANNDGAPWGLGNVHWITSTLQANNSRYFEGMSTPQRIILSGIPATTGNLHTLHIRHQANKSTSTHAYDYLTSWDQAVSAATAIGGPLLITNLGPNACGQEIPSSLASVCSSLHTSGNIINVAAPDNMGILLGDNVQTSASNYEARFGDRKIKIYGNAPITAASVTFDGYVPPTGDSDATYSINWTSVSTDIVVEFACHIGVSVDPLTAGIGYGANRGAGSISGGPYHIQLGDIDGIILGNQANQLAGADIQTPPPPCGASANAPICTGSTLQLNATTVPNATYGWAGPAGFTSTQQNPAILNATQANSGTYTLTVTSNGVSSTCSLSNIVVYPPITLVISTNNVSCFGGSNGSLTVTASGGKIGGTYDYSWSPGGQTAPMISGLTNGTYTVTVSDGSCTATATATVRQPPQLTVTVNSASMCPGQTADLTASPSGGSGPYTYSWNTSPVKTTQTITVSPSSTTTYTVTVTDASNCTAQASGTVTVGPSAPCGITGNNPVCPSATGSYSGPAGNTSYSWTITGGGSIMGSSTSQSVTVSAVSGCNTNFTLVLATTRSGCPISSMCTQVVSVIDNTAPNLTVPTGNYLGCNPTPPTDASVKAQVTATDNCSGVLITNVSHVDTTNVCLITRTFTVNASDACNNTNSQTVVYTWTSDTTPPTLILPTGTNFGCNPATTPGDSDIAALVTATDTCSAVTTNISHLDTTNGCAITRTFTVMATDGCANSVTNSVAYTWTADTTPPTISGVGGPATIQCPTPPVFSTPTASDNCGSVTMTNGDSTTPGPCPGTYTVTRTWVAVDGCGNATTNSQTITVADTTAPTITGVGPDGTVECPVDPTTAFSNPVPHDTCDANVQISHKDLTNAVGCLIKVTRTWTAWDCSLNTNTASQTITVVDTTKPTITGVGPDGTVECPADPTSAFSTATPHDSCDANVQISHADVTNAVGCLIKVTRTWTAWDCSLNTNTASQTITVVDTAKPTITGVGPDGTVECPADPTTAFSTATPHDSCDANVQISHADVTNAVGCLIKVTRTWTAWDCSLNTNTASQTITVVDTAKPTITGVGPDGTVECPADPTTAFSTATPHDSCDANVQISHADVTNAVGCLIKVTRTWTAWDCSLNTNTASQTITVVDTAKPTITGVGPDGTVECPADPTTAFSTATPHDSCDANVQISHADVTNAVGCLIKVTRTWTAWDCSLNTNTASQTITVVDTTKPTITGVGPDGTVECPADPTTAFSTATPDDSCDANVQISHADVTNAVGCLIKVTRTWTAWDCSLNTNTASQTITVVDTTKPTITGVGPDGTVECPADPTTAFSTATPHDSCDANVQISHADATNAVGCLIKVTRTWTAWDCSLNTNTASQTITVVDTTKPTITGVGPDGTVECPADPTTAFSTATPHDSCDANVQISHADVTNAVGCLIKVTRTWTAWDCSLNTNTASQTITVVDTTKPTITGVGPDGTVECPADPTTAFSTATPHDSCDANVQISHADVTNAVGCLIKVTRTWTAWDCSLNTNTASQIITVVDTTKPTITGVGPDGTVECPADPTSAFSTATPHDSCDANVQISHADVTNAVGCLIKVTRTWTAWDCSLNTNTASQTITVVDTAKPTITGVGPDGTVECPADPTTAFTTATPHDSCDANVQISHADVTNAVGCLIKVTRTWTAWDCSLNTNTASQTITVVDTTKPTITGVGPDGTVECPADPTTAFSTATPDDSCDANVQISHADVTNAVGCLIKVTRTWTAWDCSLNTNTASQTITVVDTTKPTITGVGPDGTVECPADPTSAFSTATPHDSCDANVQISHADMTNAVGCLIKVTRTWTAWDCSLNTNTASQTITVVDTTKPTITGVGPDGTVECPADPTTAFSTATPHDSCDANVQISHADVTNAVGCLIKVTRTWTAWDCSLNTNTASQTITVVDTTKPTITGVGPDGTVECPADPTTAFSTATPHDSCDANVQISHADVTNAVGCLIKVTRTWTAWDCSLNTNTASQTITVVDTTKPTITGVGPDGTVECPADPTTAFSTATPHDSCDANVQISHADVTNAVGCLIKVTRTWTAWDCSLNTNTASQTISQVDTTKPTIAGVGANGTVECPTDPTTAFSTAGVTDMCDGNPHLIHADVTNILTCGISVTRTWTAWDCSLNTNTASQTISQVDTTKPTITGVGPNGTVECPTDPTTAFSTAGVTDTCDGNPHLIHKDVTNVLACGVSVTRTWTAWDCSLNTNTASQTISQVDTTKPTITGVGANGTVECPTDPTTAFSTAGVTDTCDGNPHLIHKDVTNTLTCGISVTRTWTAWDCSLNTNTASQTISQVDTTKPTITGVGPNGTVECPTDPTIGFSTAGVTDTCDGNPHLIHKDVTNVLTCGISVTRTWTAWDCSLNTNTASQTISQVDTTKPTITGVGPNGTVECPTDPTTGFSTAGVTDTCDGNPHLIHADVTNVLTCGISVTRTWTAWDCSLNTNTASQTISQVDTTKPTITGVGPNGTVECPTDPTTGFSTAGVTDTCDGNPHLIHKDVTNVLTCGISMTRTWTAWDCSLNTNTASQTISQVDTTKPTITGVGPNGAVECPTDPTTAFSTAGVTDTCDGNPHLIHKDVTNTLTCGISVTRTWTAWDCSLNTNTASQTISQVDTTKPTITGVGPNGTVECPTDPTTGFSTAGVTDTCDGNPHLIHKDVTNVLTCGVSVTRTWTAWDCSLNTNTASQTISQVDTTKPTITGVGPNGTVECPTDPTTAFSTAGVTDTCDGNPHLIHKDVTNTLTCGISVTRTWTAWDCSLNTNTASQTISQVDTTKPTITGVGPNGTVECPTDPSTAFSTAGVTDTCDGNPHLIHKDVTNVLTCGISVTRTWTAWDCSLNTNTASQTISQVDTTKPTITGVGANGTVECQTDPTTAFSTAGVTDTCDGNPHLIHKDVTNVLACGVSVTRTWTAWDCSLNTNTASQTISQVDTTKPTITGVGPNGTVECPTDPTTGFSTAGVTDTCDGNPHLIHKDVTNVLACGVSVTRTWTAWDCSLNTNTASQTISQVDTTKPTITGVGPNGTVECPTDPTTAFSTAGVTDTCDGNPHLIHKDVTNTLTCGISVTRTWTAWDCSLNTNTASQTISQVDTTKPTITGVGANGTVECLTDPTTAFSTAGVTDTCDGNPHLIHKDVTNTLTCGISVTRTWTAWDCSLNTNTASQTISQVDTTKPTITGVGPNGTVECPTDPTTAFSTAGVTDTCDGNPHLIHKDVTNVLTCGISVTRTWTAWDCSLNTNTASQTISQVDTTKPTITGVGANGTVECPTDPTTAFSTAGVTDTCDGNPHLIHKDVTNVLTCGISVTRTWTAWDCSLNTNTASQTISQVDTTKPTITGVGANGTVECPTDPTTAFSTAGVTDTCDGNPHLIHKDVTNVLTCGISVTRTWTAWDCSLNTNTASQTISQVDTTKPTITGVGANGTVECPTDPTTGFSTAGVTDTCDGNPHLIHKDVTNVLACGVSVTRTWTAWDCSLNTNTASQTISQVDTTKPTITGVGANGTVECPTYPTTAFSTAGVTDTCDGNPHLIHADVTNILTCGISVTRTWTAWDCSLNTNTASQTISQVDTTKPTITGVGPNGTVECPTDPTTGFSTAGVTDTCDGNPHLIHKDVTNVLACGVSVTRTWTAWDCSLNTNTASQTISQVDTTKPTITGVGPNGTVECPTDPTTAFSTAGVTDTCDGNPHLIHKDVTNTLTCGISVTRTWTAWDCSLNTNTASQTISQVDTTKPTITGVGANGTVECLTDPTTAFSTAGVTDTCDGNPHLIHKDVTNTLTCGISVTRTWTAWDCSLNTNTASQTISQVDTTKPTITGVGPNGTVECPTDPTTAFSTAGVTDTCDGNPHLIHKDVTNVLTCGISVTRTWTAWDCSLNTNTASQTISQVDTTKPTITGVGANGTVECPTDPTTAFSTAGVTDTCDGNPHLIHKDVTNVLTCGISVTRTWTAWDCSLNTNTASQTISQVDTTKPTITGVGANGTVECPTDPTTAFSTAGVTDTCDGNPHLIHKDVTNTLTCGISVTRTWTAWDCSLNTNTASQTISQVDTTKPTITGVGANGTVECPTDPTTAFSTAGVTDTCDGNPHLIHKDVTNTLTCGISVTRTWTAWDCSLNTNTASQTISQVDTTKPTITGVGANGTVECPTDPTTAFSTAGVTDTCDGNPHLIHKDVTNTLTCGISVKRTWTAWDCSGNTNTASQTISQVDTTAPSITCPTNRVVACGGDTSTNAMGAATATDTCSSTTINYNDTTNTGNCALNYTIARKWIAMDGCGNSSVCTQMITVACSLNIVTNCTSPNPDPTKMDQAGAYVTLPTLPPGYTCNYPSPSFFTAAGSPYTVVCTSTNGVPCSFTVTVSNTCPQTCIPTVIQFMGCPDPNGGTYQCLGDVPPATNNVSAVDNCGNDVPVTLKAITNGPACSLTITRIWSAVCPINGLSNYCSQTIAVSDTTGPRIDCPQDQILPCGSAVVFGTATATDNCGGTPTMTYTNLPATVDAGGNTIYKRTWTATDSCTNHSSCTQTITVQPCFGSICAVKFYDRNGNGTQDTGEPGISGWRITLTGGPNNISLTNVTDSGGTICFSNLPPGTYTLREGTSLQSKWTNTTPKSVQVILTTTSQTIKFGNVCLGGGGGLTIGFWGNKNGQAVLNNCTGGMTANLAFLTGLNLRNGDGTCFDPTKYTQVDSWLQGANAVNMAYMLSAQLTASELNVRENGCATSTQYGGGVSGSSIIYAPGTLSANANGFATLQAVMDEANALLGADCKVTTVFLTGSPLRARAEALKIALDNANNNLNFVQQTPCSRSF